MKKLKTSTNHKNINIKSKIIYLLLSLTTTLLSSCASRPSPSDFPDDTPDTNRKIVQTFEKWLDNENLGNGDRIYGYKKLLIANSNLGDCKSAVTALNNYLHYYSMASSEELKEEWPSRLDINILHPSGTQLRGFYGRQAECINNNTELLSPESSLFIYRRLYLSSLSQERHSLPYKYFMPQLLKEINHRYSYFNSDKELIQQLESADAIRDAFLKKNGPLQEYDSSTALNLDIGKINDKKLIEIINSLEQKRIYFLTDTLDYGRNESARWAKIHEKWHDRAIEEQIEKERAINQVDSPSLTSALLGAGIAAAAHANNPSAMRESLRNSAIDYVAGPDNAALAGVAKGIASGNKATTQQALGNAAIDYAAGDSQEMAAAAKQMLSQYQNSNRASGAKLSGDCQRQINAIKLPNVSTSGGPAACPAFQAQAKAYAQIADVASRCATPAEAADARRAANEAAQAAKQFCGDTSSYPPRQSYTPPSRARPPQPATPEAKEECQPDLIGSKCPRN